jgi:uncharacterized membrane protein
MKNRLLILVGFFLTTRAWAQSAEMADTMRSEGKIYVLVSIILSILVGVLIYLITLDRKVSKLEDRLSEKK